MRIALKTSNLRGTNPTLSANMKRTVLTSAIALTLGLLSADAADKVDFGKQVYPILREKCLSCHAAPYKDSRGRTKKPKAGLRLDTVEWIQKGYLDDDDNPKQAVVAGNPAKSPLYTSTALPADHDDIMPPKGDPLSKAEQSLLKNWITQGANFGDFKAPAYKNPKAK